MKLTCSSLRQNRHYVDGFRDETYSGSSITFFSLHLGCLFRLRFSTMTTRITMKLYHGDGDGLGTKV